MNNSYDLMIKRFKLMPTKWTGEKGQEPEREYETSFYYERVDTLEKALEIFMQLYKNDK